MRRGRVVPPGTILAPRGADHLQRLRRVEPAVVERAAGDGAFELPGARLGHRLDVVDRGEPARRDHRDRDRVGERDGGVPVDALEHAVARHVGVDDRGDAGVLEPPGDVERGQLRGLGPAFDRDLAVPGVEADRDALRKFLRRFLHQRRIAHRRGADDDAVDALLQPALDRLHVADAAAELHAEPDRLEDALHRGDVHRLAGERAVEIDHVQMLEALRPRRHAPAPPDRG